jgi:hypothetical protein
MRAKKLSTLIILLFTAAFAHAATRLVPAQYPNIQAAIDGCNDGDTVIVAPGTYTGPGNRDIDFRGKPITVRSIDPNDHDIVAATIIDCNGGPSNYHRGFNFHTGEARNSILAGFTIANGYADFGGAIFLNAASPTITHSRLCNNHAVYEGGAISTSKCTPAVTNCEITGNSAASSGGIETVDSTLAIANCVITDNSAVGGISGLGSGGGIVLLRGNAIITNCTIANNSAVSTGGGIICSQNKPTISNSIIWGNSAPSATNIYGQALVSYSNIQGGFSGAGNIDTDPLFADLDSGDYHLSASSPCIDAGNPAYHPAPGETDIDGQPRLFGERVDMGADEFLMPGRSAIVVSPRTVGFSLFEGHDNPQQTTIQIWNVGVGSLNWQITEDCPWLQVNPQGGTSRGDANEITLTANASFLPWGHFDCNLAISDPNAFNSPLVVPVSLEVIGPILSVGSNRFDFQAGKENPMPPYQTLIIQNGGGGTLNWQITTPNDCNWLSVYPLTGQSTGQINEVTLRVDAIGLDYGSYSCQLLISDPNAQQGLRTIQVNLSLPAPVIAVEPAKFQFHAWIDNPTPPEQVLSIRNAGGDTVNWQISIPDNCPWLAVYPPAGRSSGDANAVTLHVDATGLADGFYNCTLTISDPNAANSPQSVKVELLLGIQEGWVYVPSEHPNIQAAIDWALPGDIVVVAPGTYTGPGNRPSDFKSKAITLTSIDPNDATIVARTIIDCNGGPGDYHCGFDFHTSEDGDSILAGFTIINGYAQQGAGIRIRITFGGRGVPLTDPVKCRIINCIITRNTAIYDGGGVCILASSPTITNCTITDNKSRSGGGMLCWRSDAVVTNCKFARNSASFGGGASCSEGDVLILANCTFTSNSADVGGAVYSSGSSPSITCCTISENTALSGGGALYSYYSGNPMLDNSILYSDTAPRGPEIALAPYSRDPSLLNLVVSYSNICGGLSAVARSMVEYPPRAAQTISAQGGAAVDWGPGNINAEPYFVDANNGDYHLKSGGWRWDAQRKTWTWDAVTSRCIDAGDPDAPLRDEPLFVPVDPTGYWGANLRINMGAYGGTAEASIPPHGWAIRTDYNNDGVINFTDFAYWTKSHPYTTGEPLGPLNPGPALAPLCLAVLAADWLDQTSWPEVPAQASAPNPPDGSVGIRLDPVLGWEAGAGATSHDVYFGTADPPTFQASTPATTFAPDTLSKSTTYYWRIDEANPFGKTAGPLWTFTTVSTQPR